ncbi:hypothetical protein PEPNEM18_01679 [Aedoeadaptatus nemausensis]|uniref:Uncharacterized protein n=1 Tax=Aedoeadaptatus nemausensis TaxID=2582829 RepID=A0A6V6Y7K4_9FIRM|nr:hypothetical protein PEPNEM18_01679 [Peptoniphilus nemausensis]
MSFQVFFTPSINPDQNSDRKFVISVQVLVQDSDIPCQRFTKNSFIPFQMATVDSLIVSQIEMTPSLNQSHFFHKRTRPAITAPIAIGTIPMADTTAVIAGISVPVKIPTILVIPPTIRGPLVIIVPIDQISFPTIISTGPRAAIKRPIPAIIPFTGPGSALSPFTSFVNISTAFLTAGIKSSPKDIANSSKADCRIFN